MKLETCSLIALAGSLVWWAGPAAGADLPSATDTPGARRPGSAITERLPRGSDLVPAPRRPRRARVGVAVIRAVRVSGQLWVAFEIRNPGPHAFALHEVRVIDARGQEHRVARLSLLAPAVPGERGAVNVPGRTRARGVLEVPHAHYGGPGPRAIVFQGAAGTGAVVAAMSEWAWPAMTAKEAP